MQVIDKVKEDSFKRDGELQSSVVETAQAADQLVRGSLICGCCFIKS